MDLRLDGRRAAVAAASGGLGLAVARALAREGVAVAICGRDQVRIDEAAESVGSGCTAMLVDLSGPTGPEDFIDRASRHLGGVDILVCNAPGPPPSTFGTSSIDDYQRALELNLLSTVRMCQSAVPAMRARGWGRVLAITSIAVRQPIPGLILSNTARAGLTGFLKSLAHEVAADGVTVNSLQPGLHETERVRSVYGSNLTDEIATIPVRRLGTPDDFGAVAAFLCSAAAGYITGAAVPVDGGAYLGLQ